MADQPERSSEPPRVLLVHEPPDGGVSQHVMHLALGLGAHGFAVEVAGPTQSTIADPLSAAGIELHEIPLVRSFHRPDEDARAVAEIARLVRRRGIQIVHSHSSKAGALTRIAAWATGVPSIYSPHCFGFVGHVKRSRKLIVWALERAFGHLTDAIVCVCEAERRRALELQIAPAERLHTILQGVPACALGVAADPAVLELRRHGPVVGAINVLRPQKRVDVIFDAVPHVWRAVPAARFVIVGNGPLDGALRQRAVQSGLDSDCRFCFIPFSPPSERYLRSFDLFVLASDWEALPISVLEAMACGIPQVATGVDGTPEAVDAGTGRLVPPGDPRALAHALIELLRNPAARESMAEASRARHRERFTVSRMVAEVAQLYRSMLRARAPSRRSKS